MAGPDIAAGDILVCEPTDVIHPDDRQLVAFLRTSAPAQSLPGWIDGDRIVLATSTGFSSTPRAKTLGVGRMVEVRRILRATDILGQVGKRGTILRPAAMKSVV